MELPEGRDSAPRQRPHQRDCILPDGTLLAVASSIGIWLYDTATAQEVTLLTGHTGRVYSVVFSPDGTTLASGSGDDTLRLWDVATGDMLNTPHRAYGQCQQRCLQSGWHHPR